MGDERLFRASHPPVSYSLRVTSYELLVTSYKLDVARTRNP